jgi:hypothetical protein
MKTVLGLLLFFLILALARSDVLAQNSPGWSQGFVPMAGPWNGAFAAKQDVLGVTPLNSGFQSPGRGPEVVVVARSQRAPLAAPPLPPDVSNREAVAVIDGANVIRDHSPLPII